MQVSIGFTCRECGQDQEFRTDTADYGLLVKLARPDGRGTFVPARLEAVVDMAQVLELRCTCGHVSGELGLGYQYREDHRPSHDREQELAS